MTSTQMAILTMAYAISCFIVDTTHICNLLTYLTLVEHLGSSICTHKYAQQLNMVPLLYASKQSFKPHEKCSHVWNIKLSDNKLMGISLFWVG